MSSYAIPHVHIHMYVYACTYVHELYDVSEAIFSSDVSSNPLLTSLVEGIII